MEQPARRALTDPALLGTALLGLLAAYGVGSTPGLAARWGVSAEGIALALGWSLAAALAMPLIRAAPARGQLAALAGLALAMRSAAALLVIGRAPQGDAQCYLALAASLRAGHGLAIVDPFLGITVRAFFPPLYPCLLALWSAVFGISTWSLLLLSTLTDAAAAAVIVWLGRRAGKEGAARGAAWLYLIWPSVLFSAPLAQKESLCALLVLLLAAGWVAASDAARRRAPTVVIGLAAGLLALTQPGETALAGLFGLVLVRRLHIAGVLRTGVPAALLGALVILPWWVRNWLVFGRFVPLTSAGGVGLWIGNNPEATGGWMPTPPALHGLPELELSRRASVIARAWIASEPIAFLRLNAAKFFRACGVGQAGLVRLAAMHPPIGARGGALLLPLSHGAHVALLGVAAIAVRTRRDRGATTLLLIAAACAAQLILFGVWFEFSERHREFATPFLLLLICVALQHRNAPAAPHDGD